MPAPKPTTPAPATPVPVAPLGWTSPKVQDFATPAPMGKVRAAYPSMDFYGSGTDTSKRGTYAPDRVLSVSDGVLTMDLHAENGQPLVACVMPFSYAAQTYGRYSLKLRCVNADAGYKVAFMLWPASDRWSQGEVDFPEGSLDSTIGGYVHELGEHPERNAASVDTHTSFGDWHVATIEWVPDGVTFYLDDKQVAHTSTSPTQPMRWTLQGETNIGGRAPAATAHARVEIDWCVQWARASSKR